jgi:FkbM family methyltransferase
MIINNDYIISRMLSALKEQQTFVEQKTFLLRPLRQLVRHIPWVYKIIYSFLNPIYVYYVYYKSKKQLNIPENAILFEDVYNLGMNFIQYCLDNTVYFDTRDFFPEKDDRLIQQHIDYRIKIFIKARAEAMSDEQLECLHLMKIMNNNIKKRKGFYVLSSDNREYCLPRRQFEINTWGYHYGLKQLPNEVKTYIANKDFLDIGAFIGDSALMFLQYRPNRIFAYEPVTNTYQYLIKTIEKDRNTKISAIKKGIGDKKITMEIALQGSASTVIENHTVLPTEKIEITTIDEECNDKTVGLIKMDIEGFEYFAIKGGIETIKRDKPVLLISIYHTGKDFFEIPQMIKSCVPEYSFRYLDLMPCHPIVEKVLAGYIL